MYHTINNAVKLVKIEEAEVLNNFFLPQSSMAVSLPIPHEWMDSGMGTGGAKSFLV